MGLTTPLSFISPTFPQVFLQQRCPLCQILDTIRGERISHTCGDDTEHVLLGVNFGSTLDSTKLFDWDLLHFVGRRGWVVLVYHELETTAARDFEHYVTIFPLWGVRGREEVREGRDGREDEWGRGYSGREKDGVERKKSKGRKEGRMVNVKPCFRQNRRHDEKELKSKY